MIPLDAIQLHSGVWVVRPVNQLGTCGFYPTPWAAYFTRARSAEDAIRKARVHEYKKRKS